jgi:ABC-type lipoprotein export system ATPase subunit
VLLQLENVVRRHPHSDRKPLIDDLSLDVDRGGFVGIWGQRRSGKTLLLHLAAGIELPDQGTVRIDGVATTTMSSTERGALRLAQIGMVDRSEPHSRDERVEDLVALPLRATETKRRARERARDALDHVGLGGYASSRWRDLADSERVLTRIAAAIVRGPKLLLADEPTADLDHLQQEEVITLLRALADESNAAVLMTAGSMTALAKTTDTYVLRHGRLSELGGSAGELLQFKRPT